MSKTAYANRMTPAEFAEATEGLTPEECEEVRIEEIASPLFDMWLRFETAFANRAIDRLDVTDEDAEAAAKIMEASGTASGAAFAYLLRCIRSRRCLRELSHKVSAIWATQDAPEALSFDRIHELYEKLPKGNA